MNLSRAPLSWKRDSSLETAKRIFEIILRTSANGISTRFSSSTVGSVGKSSGGKPWILKRELPALIVSSRGSSWMRWTSWPTSERMISMNFFAWTAIAPSAATSASQKEVSDTSRSVAARLSRSPLAESRRWASTGIVVLRSTMPCIGASSARNWLRSTRTSIALLPPWKDRGIYSTAEVVHRSCGTADGCRKYHRSKGLSSPQSAEDRVSRTCGREVENSRARSFPQLVHRPAHRDLHSKSGGGRGQEKCSWIRRTVRSRSSSVVRSCSIFSTPYMTVE